VNGPNQPGFQHRPERPLLTLPVRQERPVATRTISSDHLFAGDREIGIEHRGSLYRLKITRQGKPADIRREGHPSLRERDLPAKPGRTSRTGTHSA
jgi:hemin uptake protein HemP